MKTYYANIFKDAKGAEFSEGVFTNYDDALLDAVDSRFEYVATLTNKGIFSFTYEDKAEFTIERNAELAHRAEVNGFINRRDYA